MIDSCEAGKAALALWGVSVFAGLMFLLGKCLYDFGFSSGRDMQLKDFRKLLAAREKKSDA